MNEETRFDKEFEELMRGISTIGGPMIAYEDMFKFLERRFESGGRKAVSQTIGACILLCEKPMRYVFSGKTKSQHDNNEVGGNSWDEKMIRVLPFHYGAELDNLKDIIQDRIDNKGYKVAFSKVNVSMVRRVALVSCEHLFGNKSYNRIVTEYQIQYGCRPSEIDVEKHVKMIELRRKSERSYEIKVEQIENHNTDKIYWNTDAYKNFYNAL
jgi:hypothetical protein